MCGTTSSCPLSDMPENLDVATTWFSGYLKAFRNWVARRCRSPRTPLGQPPSLLCHCFDFRDFVHCRINERCKAQISQHRWDICKDTGSRTDGWLIHAVCARCVFGPKPHVIDEITRERSEYRYALDPKGRVLWRLLAILPFLKHFLVQTFALSKLRPTSPTGLF